MSNYIVVERPPSRGIEGRKMAMLSTRHVSKATATKLAQWSDYVEYKPDDPLSADVLDMSSEESRDSDPDGAEFMGSINAVAYGWQIALGWVMEGSEFAHKFVPQDLFLLCVACKTAGFDWLWLDRDAPEYGMFPLYYWEDEEES